MHDCSTFVWKKFDNISNSSESVNLSNYDDKLIDGGDMREFFKLLFKKSFNSMLNEKVKSKSKYIFIYLWLINNSAIFHTMKIATLL